MRMHKGLLTGCLALGAAMPVWGAPKPPSVADMLAFKPSQKGVVYSIPTAAEQAQCKVELATTGKTTGWLLRDGKGQMLRKFSDSKDDRDNYPDQMSYYKDGIEVYRELDTNFNGRFDQYRWLNIGGMKIGIDRNEDGTVDSWQAISVEELSQEVLRAVIDKDFRRLETVLVTEEDLQKLGMPNGDYARIREVRKLARGKFDQTTSKFSHLNENTRWLRFEASPPSRLPADTVASMKQDVLMYYRGVILCDTGGKHDFIQVGEIVKIDDAWKLIDAPLPGGTDTMTTDPLAGNPGAPATNIGGNPATQPIIDKIAALDASAPAQTGTGVNPALVRYHMQRADLLEQLIAKLPDSEREQWQKQLADSLNAAAQASSPTDTRALDRIVQLAAQVVRDKPGSQLAAYVAYRQLAAENGLKLAAARKPEEILAVQNKFQDKLEQFVQTYPTGEDTPEALLQLGMNYEFQGKETDAKKWYEQLAKQFASTPQGLKGAGALRRLNLEGQRWELNAPAVELSGPAFSMDRIRGKVAVVYYWSTLYPNVQADFTKLKQLMQSYGSRGFEIVAINMDDTQAEAEAFVNRTRPPGYQLYGGGLEGPLASHYGLIVFPNMFLIDSTGKVASRTVQMGNLEDEVKKLLK